MTLLATRPRLGFLGLGWIGRHRLEAIADSVEVAAVADPAVHGALDTFEELLERELDGVVIATPSGLHAEQAVAALEAGIAVFCQKPLGRTGDEAAAVVEAARAADVLLGVDLCYRETEAARAVKEHVALVGDVYAAELSFHNAHGPDKAWFYDPALAGGGCMIDLGIHLVDLAVWTLGFPEVVRVVARLVRHGGHDVEDYAVARLDLAGGTAVSISCSWNLPAGRDCILAAAFFGARGGAALRNVGGSYYDLRAEAFRGTTSETLVEPPDEWGGRAIRRWAEALARGARFDPAVERMVDLHRVLDRIYEADG